MSGSSTSPPNMSPTTREILSKAQRMIPPMLDRFHKGVCSPSRCLISDTFALVRRGLLISGCF